MLQGEVSTNQRISGTVSSKFNIEGVVYSGIRLINQGYNKSEIDAKVNAKQDKLSVSQLANINADHSQYLTEHQDLSEYAKLTDIQSVSVPTNVSAFTNDAGYLTQHQDISGKQDIINDLANIRSGASLGATALQSYTETDPIYLADKPSIALKSELFSGNYNDLTNRPTIFSGSYTDLTNKPTIPTIPANVSAFTNDAGYLTSHQSLSAYALRSELFSKNYNDLTNKPTIPAQVTDEHINSLIDAKLGVIENGSY